MFYRKIIKKILVIILICGLFVLFLAYLSSRGRDGSETTLARNIVYNGEKISLIERIKEEEKETSLVIKKNGKKEEISKFYQNNEIPVEIIQVFTFKTKKDEYIVAITNSYFKTNNEITNFDGFIKGIQIYDSSYNRKYDIEQKFYISENEEKFYEFNLDNKDLIIQKLQELEKEILL